MGGRTQAQAQAQAQSQAQPQFLQRSRSTPRHCHACTPPADAQPPFSANLTGATTRSAAPRSKSAARSRSSSTSSKENREITSPSPRATTTTLNSSSHAAKRQQSIVSPRPYPSAWALSPGRSPDPPPAAEEEEKKKGKGMMGFLTMRRRRKEATEREEALHQMRVMGCRLLQWRFVNARRERAMARARSTAERKLFFVWLRINELRNMVAAKRIVIQRKRHKLKLARILRPQAHLLSHWELNSKRHAEVVSALSGALETAYLPIPLVDGAQVDSGLLHSYISTSLEIMAEIEAAVRTFYSKVAEVSTILSELVETATLAMTGLEELIGTCQRITALEMHETSLRANLIQAMRKEIEPASRLQAWMQSYQWPIYIYLTHNFIN